MPDRQIIQESERLIQWLDCQIDGLPMPNEFRNRLAGGCFDMAMEHQKAIVALVAHKLFGSAFALARLITEAYVRGVWLYECATENELREFTKSEPPRFPILVAAIEKLEGYEDGVFSELKKNAWKSMNAYTHTGYHQITRRQTESTIEANYCDDEIFEVVNFANAIGCLAAIATCKIGNDIERIRAIFERMKMEFPPNNVG